MPFGHIKDLESIVVNHPEASKAFKRVLVGPNQGWDSHVLRIFDVEAGGYTPKHQHDWPHINFILEGEGTLLVDGKEESIQAGHYAFIPNNTDHQFRASADKALKFMCIIPIEGQS